jgi:hypothetical protein
LLNFQALTISFVPKTYDFTPLLFNSLRKFVPKFSLEHHHVNSARCNALDIPQAKPAALPVAR